MCSGESGNAEISRSRSPTQRNTQRRNTISTKSKSLGSIASWRTGPGNRHASARPAAKRPSSYGQPAIDEFKLNRGGRGDKRPPMAKCDKDDNPENTNTDVTRWADPRYDDLLTLTKTQHRCAEIRAPTNLLIDAVRDECETMFTTYLAYFARGWLGAPKDLRSQTWANILKRSPHKF